ncbi:hypothetical protein BW685_22140 [Burkholderia ubonensis]|uniref:Uncharacterized protein n=2 Tax=Burkholderia ubonensis TaxID=101571 RepID=A0A1R1J7R0_9BURK|nr:hypothetical protein BW685_22140 [Burkholderia ubonensis]
MGFDGDGASNGTFLPGSSGLAKDMGLPGRLSDTQLALSVGRIQNMAREGLETGRYVIDAITGRLR